MTRLGRLLVVSRPRFWLYLAGPVLVGAAFGASTPRDLLDPAALALFAYFLVPANVLLYGVNDVFDADVDAENPKKRDRERRFEGDPWVVAAVAVAGVLGAVPFAVAPPVAWPWLAGFFVLGVAYSAPPLRLKVRPPLDSVSNGLYALPGVAAYATLAGDLPPVAAIAGAWLWTMGMHTFSAIPDVEPDRAAGIQTTATALGESLTYAYCGGCWLLAAAAFALVHPALGALLCVYPVAVAAIARSGVSVAQAYWWFPALNTAVGAALTLGGLWRLVYG